jgi:hypothetical protein
MTGFARTRTFSGSGKKVINIREVEQMIDGQKPIHLTKSTKSN